MALRRKVKLLTAKSFKLGDHVRIGLQGIEGVRPDRAKKRKVRVRNEKRRVLEATKIPTQKLRMD